MSNKPPPHNGDYDRAPNIKNLKRRGFINHRSTLGLRGLGLARVTSVLKKSFVAKTMESLPLV